MDYLLRDEPYLLKRTSVTVHLTLDSSGLDGRRMMTNGPRVCRGTFSRYLDIFNIISCILLSSSEAWLFPYASEE